MINFQNTYSKLPERFFEKGMPAEFKKPSLIAFNHELATSLGMNLKGISDEELALIFSGQKILDGSEPMALAYAAHQFGHFVPQLGDGRAHLLGEVNNFDIQLKGSGQTRFSRNGDGRSALGPVIREYILSEAMASLGVPTTRALAAVTTGDQLYRNDLEPGGVFTRVSPSHIRVGTFQYFAYRKDVEALKLLLDYAIGRHFPELSTIEDIAQKSLAFIESVGKAQASLISKWMSFGFIHGVMNTDNYSVGGFTIDFGPCAFMDEYNENKVFSSIDRNGRYSYKNQIAIGQWNLLRLVDCLVPLIHDEQDKAIEVLNKILPAIIENFEKKRWEAMAPKFGINNYMPEDKKLMQEFLEYLEVNELDFTLSFRNLKDLYEGKTQGYPESEKLNKFLSLWKARVHLAADLKEINPFIIPRNHQVEKAIQDANSGDYSLFHELNKVLKTPYSEDPQLAKYAIAPLPEQRVQQTFCGT